MAPPSTNVTIGVWIDAQSFTWTNFLAYIEWSGDCISYVSAQYVIGGIAAFPIDDFSHPRGIGFGGSGGNGSGIAHIGNVTLHINTPVSCCVTPIIDPYNPYYVFSQLGAGSAYMLFTTNPGTCYNGDCGPHGACCLPDGSCVPEFCFVECQALGGQWAGPGVECFEGCPPPQPVGACCYPDGSCLVGPIEDCSAGGGVYYGDGSTCDQVSCPQPTEACCFTNGTCENLPDETCIAQGGTPRGVGTSCSDPAIECVPTTGACCIPLPERCVETTREECDAIGGDFVFEGALCIEMWCGKTPVESSSWGNIKRLYR